MNCDRYADSSVAYQGFGRGLDVNMIRILNQLVTQSLVPDLTVLLDIPIQEVARRQGIHADRIEQGSLTFQRRVSAAYLKVVQMDFDRFFVVNGMQSIDRIHQKIVGRVIDTIQDTNKFYLQGE